MDDKRCEAKRNECPRGGRPNDGSAISDRADRVLLCPFVGAVQTNVCGNFWQFWPVNLAKSYGFLLLRVSAELVQAAIPVAGHVMRKAVDDLRHGHGIDKIDASDLQC